MPRNPTNKSPRKRMGCILIHFLNLATKMDIYADRRPPMANWPLYLYHITKHDGRLLWETSFN